MDFRFDDLKVLVVEDHPRALQLLRTTLRGLGINQIYTAKNGREAQKFLDDASEMVNLVICDWNMPKMTGLELLQQVRMTIPDMLFMMVTGRSDIESVKTVQTIGVDAYIRKPYSTRQIAAKLASLADMVKSRGAG